MTTNPRDRLAPTLEAANALEPTPRGKREQPNVATVLRAAKAAGYEKCEITTYPDGRMTVTAGPSTEPAEPVAEMTEKQKAKQVWHDLAQKR